MFKFLSVMLRLNTDNLRIVTKDYHRLTYNTPFLPFTFSSIPTFLGGNSYTKCCSKMSNSQLVSDIAENSWDYQRDFGGQPEIPGRQIELSAI